MQAEVVLTWSWIGNEDFLSLSHSANDYEIWIYNSYFLSHLF